jgi:hypothetical protein
LEDNPRIAKISDAQLLRIIYSLGDFQQALSALTFLLEECDFDSKYNHIEFRKFRCYETNLIVSFTRPFEASRGHTSLGLKTINLQLNEGENLIKEKVLNLRKKVFAHSDEEFMHFIGSVLYPFDESKIGMPIFKFQESLYLEYDELRSLEELLRKLIYSITITVF